MVRCWTLIALCIMVSSILGLIQRGVGANVENVTLLSIGFQQEGLYWASGLRTLHGLTNQARITFDKRLNQEYISRVSHSFGSLRTSPSSAYRWYGDIAITGLGRYLVCAGRYQEAINLIGLNPSRPMLYVTLGDAYVGLGDIDSAFTAYRRAECLGRSEWCAGYLLPRALNSLERGETSEAINLFRQVRSFRPFDLVASYYLWRFSPVSDEREASLNTLLYPLPASLAVQDATLQRELVKHFPEVVGQGLWDQTVAERLVAWLLWQHPREKYVGDILNRLGRSFPKYAGWARLTAELSSRRARFFEETLPLECGMGNIDADDVSWVSRRLGVTSIVPGPNLFSTSRDDETPWRVLNMAEGLFWDRGLYWLGADYLPASDKCTLRVDGLWTQRIPERHGSWAGYQLWDSRANQPRHIQLGANTVYLLAWSYRTERLSGTPTIWLGLGVQHGTGLKANYALRDTSGKWLRGRILFATDREGPGLEYLVRIFEQGSVWFTDMVLVPLTMTPDISAESLCQKPIIEISDRLE